MPWVYMLECANGSIYVGSTHNLDQRVWEHNHGLGGRHTSLHTPVKLIWAAEYERIDDAFAIERKLHSWSREKKMLLADGNFQELSGWSQRQQRSKER